MITTFFSGKRRVSCAVLIASLVAPGGCDTSTARLSAEQQRRFETEVITRRADDVTFRYTRDPGGRDERREDRQASIVVTQSSLLIHKNEKVGLEITPRTRREVSVERSGTRIRIRSGKGKAEEIWSFEAPDDATGWAADIRNVIKRRLALGLDFPHFACIIHT